MEQNDQTLCSFWNFEFKNAMIAKSDYTTRWQRYIDAYNGDYFKNKNNPDYKSNQVSNYIFSIIETIRPIMLDNDPKFQSVPRQPEGLNFASDMNEALSYEWDREDMNAKLYRELINTLSIGTSVFFLPWDKASKNVKAIPINAFNLFPDPLATSVDDAEFLIYATYKHERQLQKLFPQLADKLKGGQINYTELVQDKTDSGAQINDQILTLEIWCRDWSEMSYDDEGVKKNKLKYPKGRVIVLCPEIGVVLSDKPNPYEDGKFPFQLIKDYDVPGKFWGEGEVQQLLSPQSYMNELNNAIIDNAKHTANVPWIIDKNSGIGVGKITNRPGLVVRKNPGTEVRREQPPSMPAYVQNSVNELKGDMEQISGVFDTLKGNSETGVYTAQGILALQEAGQARIRLKVKLLENALGKLACMWCSRLKQFWKQDRWVKTTRFDGSYDLRQFTTEALEYDYDVRITAGSTMAVNRGAMLDLMIRLAQTQMPDGQPLVDRQAVVEYLPEEVKSAILRRMGKQQQIVEQQIEQLQQSLQQLAQQNQQDDKQTLSTVEQLVGAVESIKKEILHLESEHANMVEKTKQEQEKQKLQDTSYNQGYNDAAKLQGTSPDVSAQSTSNSGTSDALPDDILHGIEGMTQDELKLLIDQNPDLVTLINQQNT